MQSQLLLVTAVLEVGAGLAFLFVPAMLIELVFGPAAALPPAVGMARLAGAAILSLGTACWLARDVGHPAATAIVNAMLVYNVVVIALVFAGSLGPLGPLQSAGAGLHTTMAIWCVRVVASRPRRAPGAS